MATYEIRDEDGEYERFDAASVAEAREKALDWMSNASFGFDSELSEGTVWYRATLYEIVVRDEDYEDSEFVDRLVYTFDPPEPDCTDGQEHDWQAPYSVLGGIKQNPGVWGHGGGVIIREVCAYCGAYKETDTWAQDMTNGEQGLRSVRYEEADEASLEWIAEEENGR